MKKTTKQLVKFFEENEFSVNLIKEKRTQCAELEMWTGGGVDMLIYLRPFNAEQFKEYVRDFDIDEEIMLNRQDKTYCDHFTIRQSVNDFEEYHNKLKEIAAEL